MEQDEAVKAKADADAKNQSKTYSEEQFKELILERDKAKEKARKFEEAEKKAAEDRAKKAGEFEKLEQELKAEMAKQQAEISRLAEIEKKAIDQEKAIREKALAKITDERMRNIGSELSTARLMEFVETIETEKGSPFGGKQKSSGEKQSPYTALPGESYKQWQERISKL